MIARSIILLLFLLGAIQPAAAQDVQRRIAPSFDDVPRHAGEALIPVCWRGNAMFSGLTGHCGLTRR